MWWSAQKTQGDRLGGKQPRSKPRALTHTSTFFNLDQLLSLIVSGNSPGNSALQPRINDSYGLRSGLIPELFKALWVPPSALFLMRLFSLVSNENIFFFPADESVLRRLYLSDLILLRITKRKTLSKTHLKPSGTSTLYHPPSAAT